MPSLLCTHKSKCFLRCSVSIVTVHQNCDLHCCQTNSPSPMPPIIFLTFAQKSDIFREYLNRENNERVTQLGPLLLNPFLQAVCCASLCIWY
jgi:hypothetical protein